MLDLDVVLSPYLLADVVPHVLLGGGAWLAWRAVRAIERCAAAPGRLHALRERVRLLEATVARLEATVSQTTDAQRLTTTVLAARAVLRGESHGG